MPITSIPAFDGTLYSQRPFSYVFSSDVSEAASPQYQFTDSTPSILAATNAATATFSSTTGYSGSGPLGTLIVDYLSSNVISASNIAPGSFTQVRGLAQDSLGNLYATDCNAILKITPAGSVTTFAGNKFIGGRADGVGVTASFNYPIGLATDNDDNLYVADRFNSAIRKITPDGTVSTYSGIKGSAGVTDGKDGLARFSQVWGIAVDSNSNVYVSEIDSHVIRKITPDTQVTTIVGFGASGSSDGTGNVFQTYSNVFVAGVTAGGRPNLNLVYSFDAKTWFIFDQNPLIYYVRRVARNDNNLWLALGGGFNKFLGNPGQDWSSSMAASSDGSNYTRFPVGPPVDGVSDVMAPFNGTGFVDSADGYDAAYGNGQWVAVGVGTNNTIATSPDAQVWTGRGRSVFTTGGYGIAWGGSFWVAVGQGGNTIVSSSNGTSWTSGTGTVFNTRGRSVVYDDGLWIALGGSNVPALVSTNGTSWSSMTSGLTEISGGFGRSAAYGAGVWVLLGNTTTGLGRGYTSTDGSNWTRNTSLDFSSNAYGVIYNDVTGVWSVTGMNSGGLTSIRYTSTPTGAWNTDGVVQYVDSFTGVITPYPNIQLDSVGSVGTVTLRISIGTGRLDAPAGLTIDGNGDLFIAAAGNAKIRKFSEATNQLTTYAGSGIVGLLDGPFATARFSDLYDVKYSAADGNFYVADTTNARVRLVNSNTGLVSTYGVPTPTQPLWAFSTRNNTGYYAGDTTINRIIPPRTEVRPGGTRPAGFIIADSLTLPVTVSNRIDASSAAIGGVFQLYKYEPFGPNLFSINSNASTTDTLSFANSSADLYAFLTNPTSTQVSFGSTNGPTVSYSTPLSLVIEDLSGTTVLERITNTVFLNAGRFFPPAANTAYVFFKNEPITPQPFSATISLQQPTSSPAIPAGLSFLRTASNSFNLVGTPLVQTPATNYKIIGRGLSNSAQIVTVDINIRVAAERLRLDLDGSFNVFSMEVDTPISSRTVTGRAPPYPNTGSNIVYTWGPPLPDGLSFRNFAGVPVSSGYLALDASSTLVLAGTPTSAATQSFSNGIYQTTLTGTRITSPFISNTLLFSFSFGESVVFGSSNLTTLYANASVQSSIFSNSFTAQTKFAAVDSSISTIFSPDLRNDLSLNFVFADQRAYLTGTPLTAGIGSYTVTASNANGFSKSIVASYVISNDQVFFDYSATPAVDTCYNFIDKRPVSNALTGYYPFPIDFVASSLSGCNVTFAASGLPVGVSLSNVSSNRVRLVGTPTAVTPLASATITATATGTSAVKTTSLKIAVLNDAYTFSDVSLNFVENVAFTPIQISGSALSGFPIIQYSSSNLPAGVSLSAAGVLTGPFRVGVDGSFSVDITTGFTTASNVYSYTVIPDSIFLSTPQSSYTVPAGANVNIPVSGIAYSGGIVSNYQFSNLPTTYGLSIDSGSGLISGTVDPFPPTNVAFAVQGFVGNAVGTLDASWNTPVISFGRSAGLGPVITSPGVQYVLSYQYAPITPLVFAGSGTGRVYFFVDPASLPRGVMWNAITQTLSGSPVQVGMFAIIVYARDSTGAVTEFVLTLDVQIPRVIRTQTGAGAYTSLVRQYTEVNAAQNSRDSRVFPSQERALGEFMAPDAPSVVTPDTCKTCTP